MQKDHGALLKEAEARLLTAQEVVAAEITEYPTPISGCDAQFNHLLAERQRITAALNALAVDVFIPTPRTPSPMSGIESR